MTLDDCIKHEWRWPMTLDECIKHAKRFGPEEVYETMEAEGWPAAELAKLARHLRAIDQERWNKERNAGARFVTPSPVWELSRMQKYALLDRLLSAGNDPGIAADLTGLTPAQVERYRKEQHADDHR